MVAPTTPKSIKEPKRKRAKKGQSDVEGVPNGHGLDMSTLPEGQKTPAKRKRKDVTPASPESSRKQSTKKLKKGREKVPSPQKAQTKKTPSAVKRGKTCLRCREKKIKCNEAKPSCDQCRRGLWTCQYEIPGIKKRSRTGCINCKQRRRKCTEEQPSCAYCIRIDDDCMYADVP